MTDKEVMQMALDALERALSDDQPYIVSCKQTVEALRAALAQPEPKPVAFVVYDSESNDIVWAEAGMHLKQNTPLYIAPPQREWVGLTDEDKNQIAKEAYNKVELTAWELAQRVGEFTEAKLKEKNT